MSDPSAGRRGYPAPRRRAPFPRNARRRELSVCSSPRISPILMAPRPSDGQVCLWWPPVLGLLVGLLLAFATQPSEQSVLIKTAPRIQYRAQHLLISNANETARVGQNNVGFDRLALLTIAGPVRDAALKDLKAKGWPTIVDKSATDASSSNTSQSDSKK